MSAAKPKIGIILSTTRHGRLADKPAKWIHEMAAARGDFEVELVDLRDHPLPFFDEAMPPVMAPVKNPAAVKWGEKIASLDGFIFVTAEYNHGIPAVLKNALDYVYPQFNKKPAAYVGYGGLGAARSVDQLRILNSMQQMVCVSAAVHIGGADFMNLWKGEKSLEDLQHLHPSAHAMLEQLAWWAPRLNSIRSPH